LAEAAKAESSLDTGPSFDLGGFVVGAAFLGDTALFATGEGEIVKASRSGVEQRERPHGGAVLYCAASGDGFLTAGDDGRVRRTTLTGTTTLAEGEGRWPSALAAGPEGAVALGAGRSVTIFRAGKEPATFSAPSLASGLAFAPKGFRLAIAHNGGATLWFPGQPRAEPKLLAWKGSHIDVTFSPDGAFLVTSMQEAALHGWRIADGQHMRMTGYPGKTRSLSWSPKGKWLATSGADAAILWPFQSKDGPMGKAPREVAIRAKVQVTQVAFHPDSEVLATGFADGMVLLTRLADNAELLIARPAGSPVSALAWSARGTMLAWGTEGGQAGLFSVVKDA
jgi:WD40 repeat protein